jgi:hypothetical protein
MKISVNLGVSENTQQHTFDLEDLNLTEEAWNELCVDEKLNIIQDAVSSFEQPYWMVDDFNVL